MKKTLFRDEIGWLREWVVLSLIVGGIAILAIGLMALEHHYLSTTPCSEFHNEALRHVPLRCIEEINK